MIPLSSRKFAPLLAATVVVMLYQSSVAELPPRKALTSEKQQTFLRSRTGGGIMGSFDSYCSLLYAVHDVCIHTKEDTVDHTSLQSPFPEFYQPTWRELFDSIARQTKSAWTYDPARDFWVFDTPPKALPYQITIQEGWKAHDEGLYIGYQPKIVPVGMDIYVMGSYTAAEKKDEAPLHNKVREALAVMFAKTFKADVTARDMSETPIGGCKALFFDITAKSGVNWRQWALVDGGQAFVIVSAIKPEHEKELLPDVKKMVASFKAIPEVENDTKGATTSQGAKP